MEDCIGGAIIYEYERPELWHVVKKMRQPVFS